MKNAVEEKIRYSQLLINMIHTSEPNELRELMGKTLEDNESEISVEKGMQDLERLKNKRR